MQNHIGCYVVWKKTAAIFPAVSSREKEVPTLENASSIAADFLFPLFYYFRFSYVDVILCEKVS
jgi:hypothetical protein